METDRFDRIARLFASRRLSRRQELTGGVGSTALHAQDATPATGGSATAKTQFLFLQSFQKGAIEPKFGVDGTWTLTLEGGVGQTIYFSNRPERIVGAAPTAVFLEGLGFPEDNPPNAALLFQNEAGHEDITAIELFNPRYEIETNTATYDVQWLKEYERLDFGLQEIPEEPANAAATFGAAHLFIDDCPDGTLYCVPNECAVNFIKIGGPYCEVRGAIENGDHDGFCYSWAGAACLPCSPKFTYRSEAYAYWSNQCNVRFPACQGNCKLYHVCTYGIPYC